MTTPLERLVTRLEELGPEERDDAVEQFLHVLDHHDHRDHPLADDGVVLADWAADGGLEGVVQSLRVDVVPGPTRIAKTRAATGRALLSNGHLGADLIHVPAGEGFAPHTHVGDHLLFVLGGYGTITAGGTILRTAPGQAYMIEGTVPHAVGAITDHVLLSVGAPHRALASEERQTLTAYAALLTEAGSITCAICGVSAGDADGLAALGCAHAQPQLA